MEAYINEDNHIVVSVTKDDMKAVFSDYEALSDFCDIHKIIAQFPSPDANEFVVHQLNRMFEEWKEKYMKSYFEDDKSMEE